jgi:hypothetical protein
MAEDRRRKSEADVALTAYEYAMTRRASLSLRAAAAELDQVHPETETPADRRRRASGCLEKVKQSERILAEMAREQDGFGAIRGGFTENQRRS